MCLCDCLENNGSVWDAWHKLMWQSIKAYMKGSKRCERSWLKLCVGKCLSCGLLPSIRWMGMCLEHSKRVDSTNKAVLWMMSLILALMVKYCFEPTSEKMEGVQTYLGNLHEKSNCCGFFFIHCFLKVQHMYLTISLPSAEGSFRFVTPVHPNFLH